MRHAPPLGRRLPWLGETRGPASTAAITAPPPGQGEVRRTALPDNFDGIRFEIGRMIEYVRRARRDPFVIAHTRRICEEHAAMGRAVADPAAVCLEAIDLWCRRHYAYVNDPPNIEVIQTPQRMIRQTMVPPEVVRYIVEPCYAAMATAFGSAAAAAYEPSSVCFGDCDEGGCLFLSKCFCAAVGSPPPDGGSPYRFRFGGHDGTLHHVWSWIHGANGWRDSDLTEPDYALGEHSRFPHYEDVEIPLDDESEARVSVRLRGLGRASLGDEAAEARASLPAGFRRMAERVADGRRDAVLIDAARLMGVHYGRMVEHFSALEGTPVSAHNNKAVFLEGLDIMCRALFAAGPREGSRRATEEPAEVVEHLMRPWYEALELDDPSRYRMGPQEPPPAYVGDPVDAQCAMLAMCAALDVSPVKIVAGVRDGAAERVWGRVKADGKWYDTDVTDLGLALGDRPDYAEVQEIEVPL